MNNIMMLSTNKKLPEIAHPPSKNERKLKKQTTENRCTGHMLLKRYEPCFESAIHMVSWNVNASEVD